MFAGDCDLVVCVSYTLEFFSLSENKSEKPRDVLSRFGALILHITLHNSSFYSTLSILQLQFIAIVKVRASELLQVPQPWPKSVQGGALFCLSLIPLVSALHRADIIPTNLTFMRIR